MKVQRTDFFFGLSAIALSGAYLYFASGIQESLLSDATGAGGLPRALGWAMGALGLLLCLRSLSFAARPAETPDAQADDAPPAPWHRHPHMQALILFGILVGFVVLAPYLGYMLATAVLIAAAAAYGGAALDRNLFLISAGGGLALWVIFAKMLGISMQGSVLLEGF